MAGVSSKGKEKAGSLAQSEALQSPGSIACSVVSSVGPGTCVTVQASQEASDLQPPHVILHQLKVTRHVQKKPERLLMMLLLLLTQTPAVHALDCTKMTMGLEESGSNVFVDDGCMRIVLWGVIMVLLDLKLCSLC